MSFENELGKDEWTIGELTLVRPGGTISRLGRVALGDTVIGLHLWIEKWERNKNIESRRKKANTIPKQVYLYDEVEI